MVGENHPFSGCKYGDLKKRVVELILDEGVHEFFLITPRRYEVDERYADLLRRGEIVLQDIFREIVALGREPSPGCLWLYKVINYKVKSEHLVDLATFDKKRFSYREFCFDEYSDL